jgi:hypothetical protein
VRRRDVARVGGAVWLGLGRLLLGWVTGLVVGPLVFIAVGVDRLPIFYFTGLLAVRWLTGGSGRGRAWRLGGVAVSYLADAPFLVAEGFPHGRFLC